MTESNEILQILTFAGEITSCDFNCNNLLAIGSSDRTLRVMEWKKGLGFVDLYYSPLISHKFGISSVRFSPQGVILVSSSLDGTAILYDVETGLEIFTVVQPSKCSIRYCEFTTDSTTLVSASDNGLFCFWDLVYRTKIRSKLLLDGEDFSIRGLSISPDSEYLLSGDSNGSLNLWFIGNIKISEPKCFLTRKNIHDGLYCCEFSPKAEFTVMATEEVKYEYFMATSGADNFILIWKLIILENTSLFTNHTKDFNCELTIIHILKSHLNEVLHIKYNCMGNYLASTGLDNTVKLWETTTGACLKTLQRHSRFGISCTFTRDSKILGTGSNDKTVIIWKLNSDLNLDCDLTQNCNIVSHFANADFVTFSNEKLIFVEEKETNKKPQILQTLNFSSFVNTISFYKNHMVAVAGRAKFVSIWKRQKDLNFFKETEKIEGCKYGINYLDISPCGNYLILGSMDGALIFWNLQTSLKYEMRVPNCVNALKICKFSPNSNFIAAGGDDQMTFLWDAIKLEFKKTLTIHDEAITSLAFTPDSNYLVSTCAAGTIKLHDIKKDECSATIKNAHDLGIMACDISLAVIPKNRKSTDKNHLKSIVFNQFLLATCGKDSFIKLWYVSDGLINISNILTGHGGTVNFVKFSINQSFLLGSCGNDGTVRIWNTDSQNCLFVLNHQSAVTACSFSQDSCLIITGSLDKKIIIWSLPKKLFSEPSYTVTNTVKPLPKWSDKDVCQWFENIGCFKIANCIKLTSLNGKMILTKKLNLILSSIKLDEIKKEKTLNILINWLKKDAFTYNWKNLAKNKNFPHQFLCPLTHEVMVTPVICSDGYNYEKKAITEWFISGKLMSPMTKEPLENLKLTPNVVLKRNMCKFFYGNSSDD